MLPTPASFASPLNKCDKCGGEVIPGDVDPERTNYFGMPSRECPETYEWLITYETEEAEKTCGDAVTAAANFVTAGESYTWRKCTFMDGIEVHLCEDCGNAFIGTMAQLGDNYHKYDINDASDHGDTGGYFAQYQICTVNKPQSKKRKADESCTPNVPKKAKTTYPNDDGMHPEPPLFTMPPAGAPLAECETLILGTFPGNQTVRSGKYYDSKNNRMRYILGVHLGFWPGDDNHEPWLRKTYTHTDSKPYTERASDFASLDPTTARSYTEQMDILDAHHITLYDLWQSARPGKGSADHKLEPGEEHDFVEMFDRMPKLKTIILNGKSTACKSRVGFTRIQSMKRAIALGKIKLSADVYTQGVDKLKRFFDKNAAPSTSTARVEVRVCPSTSGAKRDITMSGSIAAWTPALPKLLTNIIRL